MSEESTVVDGWTSDIVGKDDELPVLMEDGSCWCRDSDEGSGADRRASTSTILDDSEGVEVGIELIFAVTGAAWAQLCFFKMTSASRPLSIDY